MAVAEPHHVHLLLLLDQRNWNIWTPDFIIELINTSDIIQNNIVKLGTVKCSNFIPYPIQIPPQAILPWHSGDANRSFLSLIYSRLMIPDLFPHCVFTRLKHISFSLDTLNKSQFETNFFACMLHGKISIKHKINMNINHIITCPRQVFQLT